MLCRCFSELLEVLILKQQNFFVFINVLININKNKKVFLKKINISYRYSQTSKQTKNSFKKIF